VDAKPDVVALRMPERLAALKRSGLLDSPPEPKFDRITALIRQVLGTDVALFSLVEDMRQFFASQCGLPEPYATTRETPLSHSFCQYVVELGEPLVVPDARLDPLVAQNGAVADLNVISYLGVPVRDRQGHVLGSLCAIGGSSRAWSEADIAVMSQMAHVTEDLLDLHEHALRANEVAEEYAVLAREYHHRVKNTLAVSAALVNLAAKESNSADDLARRSTARLGALASAHETVSIGTDQSDLATLVERVMMPYQAALSSAGAGSGSGGPAIAVTQEQVTPICLVLHELATNSAKYGALGQGQAVAVTWQVADGVVTLVWRERTAAVPARAEGFGRKLFDLAARQLRGAADTAWHDGELTQTLRFPAASAAPATSR
jgi:two-component sensor histidine kinase